MLVVPEFELPENIGPVLWNAALLRTDGIVHKSQRGVQVVVDLEAVCGEDFA